MSRSMRIGGATISVPNYIHRTYTEGAGWVISLPGVSCRIDDSGRPAELSMQEAVETLQDILLPDSSNGERYCNVTVTLVKTGLYKGYLQVEATHHQKEIVIGKLELHSHQLDNCPTQAKIPFNHPTLVSFLGHQGIGKIVSIWKAYLHDYTTPQLPVTQAPLTRTQRTCAPVTRTSSPTNVRFWWKDDN